MNEENKTRVLDDEDLRQVNGGITLSRLPFNGAKPDWDDLTFDSSKKPELTDLTWKSGNDEKKVNGGKL